MVSTEALIILALRPKAVEVAVDHLQPKVVWVVTSQENLMSIATKCSELAHKLNTDFNPYPLDEAMEIGEAFQRFDRILSQLENRGYEHKDILLDATGGTTPLRVGAVLAAMMRGVEVVHQRVKHYSGGRWDDYEPQDIELLPMGNPLEDTGLLREGQAVELFNRRDYVAATLVFEDLLQKIIGIERTHYYSGLLLLARGYGAWDAADYSTALEQLRDARKELSVNFIDPSLSDRAAALVNRITTNLSFLAKVRGKRRGGLCREKVVDMVENARRRIVDQKRHDDGVARLYRSVEMWHQWRLMDIYSISTYRVNWERVDKAVQKQFLEEVQTKDLPESLGLMRARLLDHLLEEKIPEDDAVLQKLVSARNASILAHGMDPVGQRTAEHFLEYLDTLVVVPDDLRAGAEHANLLAL